MKVANGYYLWAERAEGHFLREVLGRFTSKTTYKR